VDHWGVQPDMMTVAKGLTSGYIPLGATLVSGEIAEHFRTRPLVAGLTYNSHPVACAAAAACISIMQEDRLVEHAARMGELLRAELLRIQERHPCVGDVRAIGLFSLVELVKNRQTREPLVPFNATPQEMAPMQRLNAFLLANGLLTFVRWNTFFVNPPLCITEEQLREGLAIIDQGLDIVDTEVE
jgi:taurine--2-oxoglutarate transaminase